jgi:hypothetical protein
MDKRTISKHPKMPKQQTLDFPCWEMDESALTARLHTQRRMQYDAPLDHSIVFQTQVAAVQVLFKFCDVNARNGERARIQFH